MRTRTSVLGAAVASIAAVLLIGAPGTARAALSTDANEDPKAAAAIDGAFMEHLDTFTKATYGKKPVSISLVNGTSVTYVDPNGDYRTKYTASRDLKEYYEGLDYDRTSVCRKPTANGKVECFTTDRDGIWHRTVKGIGVGDFIYGVGNTYIRARGILKANAMSAQSTITPLKNGVTTSGTIKFPDGGYFMGISTTVTGGRTWLRGVMEDQVAPAAPPTKTVVIDARVVGKQKVIFPKQFTTMPIVLTPPADTTQETGSTATTDPTSSTP